MAISETKDFGRVNIMPGAVRSAVCIWYVAGDVVFQRAGRASKRSHYIRTRTDECRWQTRVLHDDRQPSSSVEVVIFGQLFVKRFALWYHWI